MKRCGLTACFDLWELATGRCVEYTCRLCDLMSGMIWYVLFFKETQCLTINCAVDRMVCQSIVPVLVVYPPMIFLQTDCLLHLHLAGFEDKAPVPAPEPPSGAPGKSSVELVCLVTSRLYGMHHHPPLEMGCVTGMIKIGGLLLVLSHYTKIQPSILLCWWYGPTQITPIQVGVDPRPKARSLIRYIPVDMRELISTATIWSGWLLYFT